MENDLDLNEYKEYATLFSNISKIANNLGLLFEYESKHQISENNNKDIENILNIFFDNRELIIEKILRKVV
jgi:hypothetical protein